MGTDEISDGRAGREGPRGLPRLPRPVSALLVGGVLVLGFLTLRPSLLHSGGAPPAAGPRPVGRSDRTPVSSPLPQLSPPPPVTVPASPPRPVGDPASGISPVSLAAVCPIATNHTTRLVVRFLLTNDTSGPLRVLSVDAVLPLKGLVPRGISVIRGDCERWLPDGRDDIVPPGDRRAVTMQFDLPKTCPWPLPVQARIRVRGLAGAAHHATPTRSVTLAILPDLGGAEFNRCDVGPA